ncbi:MAG TPA: serine protease, partial [Burkholderiaceae bacterium]|nr:serine protease [Burkholderiaceae bacterium]
SVAMQSRFLQAFGVALLVLACASRPAAAGDPLESSVWIEVARAGEVKFNGYKLPRVGEGMGVVTPAREIVTAAHVVWGASVITVIDRNGTKITARVERIDQNVDVALLHVEQRLEHFAPLRAEPVVRGERVGAVEQRRSKGPPGMMTGMVGTAHWTSHGVAVPLIFSGIKGEKGMSGGGLFDEAGELVGIVIRIDAKLGYLSALPVAELCTRFERCPAPPQPSR